MLLSENEFKRLSAKDKRFYNSLKGVEKLNLAISIRESGVLNKEETRGRHKKDCDCEKCKLSKFKTNEPEKNKSHSNGEVQSGEIGVEISEIATNETTTEKKETKAETVDTDEQIMNEKLNQFKQAAQNSEHSESATANADPAPHSPEPVEVKPIETQIEITQFISGALFLTGLDYFFPIVVKYAFGFVNPKFKRLNSKGVEKLKLTQDERQYLEQPAEAVVKHIFKDADPLMIFFILMGTIYGGKIMQLDDDDFDEPKQNIVNKKDKK